MFQRILGGAPAPTSAARHVASAPGGSARPKPALSIGGPDTGAYTSLAGPSRGILGSAAAPRVPVAGTVARSAPPPDSLRAAEAAAAAAAAAGAALVAASAATTVAQTSSSATAAPSSANAEVRSASKDPAVATSDGSVASADAAFGGAGAEHRTSGVDAGASVTSAASAVAGVEAPAPTTASRAPASAALSLAPPLPAPSGFAAGAVRGSIPAPGRSWEDAATFPAMRAAKFARVLGTSGGSGVVDVEALRELAWSGVPCCYRVAVWQTLLGHLPPNRGRQAAAIAAKKLEYRQCVAQYLLGGSGSGWGATLAGAPAGAPGGSGAGATPVAMTTAASGGAAAPVTASAALALAAAGLHSSSTAARSATPPAAVPCPMPSTSGGATSTPACHAPAPVPAPAPSLGMPRSEAEQALLRQVLVDVPRTNPSIPLFRVDFVQRSLERVLYVWALRHPASGYVQGINDLATPFYAVFLSPWVSIGDRDLTHVPPSALLDVEADVYWCLTRLLDGIQDHFTPSQPGIQRMIYRLRELVHRIDGAFALACPSTCMLFLFVCLSPHLGAVSCVPLLTPLPLLPFLLLLLLLL